MFMQHRVIRKGLAPNTMTGAIAPTQRVKIQSTAFTDDALGRFVCSDWAETRASLADGGATFDLRSELSGTKPSD